ncbi:MAG TPA: terminase small subunit [Patescibacteria group bacterium]|nr:terminase small subunit [Patescibacteria group bacterium]
MKLTFKQRLFIANYLKTGNATKAAARAYNVKSRNVAGEYRRYSNLFSQ